MSDYNEQKIIGLLGDILNVLKGIDKSLGNIEFNTSDISEINTVANTIARIERKINK